MGTERSSVLMWFRRDLRLGDNAALVAACASGAAVIPVFILDPETERIGAAARWRLGLSIEALRIALRNIGSDLILRRGPATEVLTALARECGAAEIHWTRLYAPETVERDRLVKSALEADGLAATSHRGFLLNEPWQPRTKAGGNFRVYSPFWKAVSSNDPGDAVARPSRIPAPASWPRSDALEDWKLGAGMARGAPIVAKYAHVGEETAIARLDEFVSDRMQNYGTERDRPDLDMTSGLSENLTYGEISPATIWRRAEMERDRAPAAVEKFLKELVWREFAWHLMWHSPTLASANWREGWDQFPWREDNPDAERWRRGMTGEPMIDAGMRQMYVTGTMHNRVRMLVASYLTKHLLTHWRVGLNWFADCLTDWDPASNAMGWQWVAGSGPDAAPYFRIFNPQTQAEKFDPNEIYRQRYIAELSEGHPTGPAHDFFRAAPESWKIDSSKPYPKPLIALKKGREAALAAYKDKTAA